jgi:hypothetical protein
MTQTAAAGLIPWYRSGLIRRWGRGCAAAVMATVRAVAGARTPSP